MILGVFVNALFLLGMYWKVLSTHKDVEDAVSEVVGDEDLTYHRFSPATMSHLSPSDSRRWPADGMEDDHSVGSMKSLSVGVETLRSRIGLPESKVRKAASGDIEPDRSSPASKTAVIDESLGLQDAASPRWAESVNGEVYVQARKVLEGQEMDEKWRRMIWKTCVYLVTLGMLIALLMGLNMSWTALTAALALVVLDFKDAMPCIEKVPYSLLIFFCGMFITVDGFNKTGVPGKLCDIMELYSQIDHPGGIAILAAVILVLSHLASNVPKVLLLGGKVAASDEVISASDERKAWLILAWVSTVAGNLSLLGSAANLVVCEQARRASHLGYNLTFWNHLKFGIPSTLIVTAIGLTLIRG